MKKILIFFLSTFLFLTGYGQEIVLKHVRNADSLTFIIENTKTGGAPVKLILRNENDSVVLRLSASGISTISGEINDTLIDHNDRINDNVDTLAVHLDTLQSHDDRINLNLDSITAHNTRINSKAPTAAPTFTGLVKRSVTATITAVNPGVQGDGALTADINEVSTVGAENDAITLPPAVAGLEIFIINNGANILEIFPASGDNLGAGLNTATTLAAGVNVTFVSYDDTNWEIK